MLLVYPNNLGMSTAHLMILDSFCVCYAAQWFDMGLKMGLVRIMMKKNNVCTCVQFCYHWMGVCGDGIIHIS